MQPDSSACPSPARGSLQKAKSWRTSETGRVSFRRKVRAAPRFRTEDLHRPHLMQVSTTPWSVPRRGARSRSSPTATSSSSRSQRTARGCSRCSADRHDNRWNGDAAPQDRRSPRLPGWKGLGHGHQGRVPPRCPRRREQLRGALLRITVAVCENGERPGLEIVRRERHSSRHEDSVSYMIHAFRGRDALRRPNTVSAGESC